MHPSQVRSHLSECPMPSPELVKDTSALSHKSATCMCDLRHKSVMYLFVWTHKSVKCISELNRKSAKCMRVESRVS